ncbi:MAG: AgmX/PglI C-terminal domain-containing protein, partial [Bdellovibrionales bacterium]|nr:AgmX/PglI C-terminal domain-containing protein [Bdellovibrionales bacterium]
ALAALGALGAPTPNPTNMPVALNINPNAGGAPKTLNSTGLIGTLKSKGGKLAASGGVSSGVKTKGKGYGTGTGYGVQGVKGSAGSRGVAGAVIGTPRLMKVNRTEGLTQKQVMAVVKQNAGKIQQCYERALLSAPGLQGRVEYGWHITPSGKVKWAKVKNSSVRNADSLNNCVITVFEKMKFPAAKNGASTEPTIGFPFGRM